MKKLILAGAALLALATGDTRASDCYTPTQTVATLVPVRQAYYKRVWYSSCYGGYYRRVLRYRTVLKTVYQQVPIAAPPLAVPQVPVIQTAPAYAPYVTAPLSVY